MTIFCSICLTWYCFYMISYRSFRISFYQNYYLRLFKVTGAIIDLLRKNKTDEWLDLLFVVKFGFWPRLIVSIWKLRTKRVHFYLYFSHIISLISISHKISLIFWYSNCITAPSLIKLIVPCILRLNILKRVIKLACSFLG